MTVKKAERPSTVVKIKNVRIEDVITIDPLTTNQGHAFEAWRKGNNLILNGSAGTGKTFMALYFALVQVLDKGTPYDSVRIIRSVVPTRDVGFLPGTIEEKLAAYETPYKAICSTLCERADAYDTMVKMGVISFESTSFLRGMTFDNSIIIVDEMQNCSGHELDTIMTRIGMDTRIIFSGDYIQSDLRAGKERSQIADFLDIVEQVSGFATVNFTWKDIVRSDMVREYIMTKEIVERERKQPLGW